MLLIRTEFGKTIGGYTHYPWDAAGGEEGKSVNDAKRKAFIFSLDMLEKFVPQGDNYLIQNKNSYGPTFGGGADIYIGDKCNIEKNSRANFPYTYNREGGNKLGNNQTTWTMFSGATNGYKFKVVEYEVFRLEIAQQ